jgi:hypothetical protein
MAVVSAQIGPVKHHFVNLDFARPTLSCPTTHVITPKIAAVYRVDRWRLFGYSVLPLPCPKAHSAISKISLQQSAMRSYVTYFVGLLYDYVERVEDPGRENGKLTGQQEIRDNIS